MTKLFQMLFLFTLIFSGSALATGQPFDQAKFDALQKEGRPIVVAVHADWCPTCRAQDPILADLLKQKEFQDITALQVDFDKQKSIVKSFKVTYQSTLIVFKGGNEIARSTGDTNKANIAALLRKAL
jgi:thioredoxin 1